LATEFPTLTERAIPRFRRGDGDHRDVARIARALRVGSGHVVVTARDVEKAESLVETALDVTDPYRVLRVSATTDGLAALAGDALAFAADAGPSVRHAGQGIVSPRRVDRGGSRRVTPGRGGRRRCRPR
jgi:hypothetical protein